jgi:class 3 adenylate cyclase/pimeloyl-ACP methyl ester carboxylesterase
VEPEIRYARTSDGLSIAYYAMGEGLTLIMLPPGLGTPINEEWNVPRLRSRAQVWSRSLQYVRYDPRGVGLSDAHADPFTIDALVRDLEAVADAVSPGDQIAIWAPGALGPIAVSYAARHPERVAKLVLWSTGPGGADMRSESITRLTQQLGRLDWDLMMESVTAAVGNFEEDQSARDMAVMYRSISPAGRDAFLRFATDCLTWDVTDLLPAVQCPTLVMHPSGSRVIPVTNARRMAAGIPGARLQLIETSSSFIPPDAVRLGSEFLLGQETVPVLPRSATSMVVVLFADIVNSTGLTEQWGDAEFRTRSGELDRTLRAVIERADGRVVEGKTLGDGVLATFPSANDALAAARQCAAAGNDAGLPLHLGLHAGDVIREGGNVYGGAVNVAARVSALSEPGEVLVSNTVRDLARTSAGVTFEDRGEHDLKGVSDPVRVFAVRGA